MAVQSEHLNGRGMAAYRGPSLQQPHRAREALKDAYAGVISPLLGFYCGITSINVAQYVATLGYDIVWVDWEHSSCGVETMTSIVQTISFFSEGMSMPFVRLPGHDHKDVAYALDAGASVVFPQVDTVEQAKHCISATKYGLKNRGTRSAPPFRLVSGVTDQKLDQKHTLHENLNRQAAVLIQIESEEGINNLDDILTQVPDIDAVWLGAMDLRVSMGLEGMWGPESEFLAAVGKYNSILAKHDMPGAGIVQGPPQIMTQLSQGRAFMIVASDVQAIMSQKQTLVEARSLMPKINSYDQGPSTPRDEPEGINKYVYLPPRDNEEMKRLNEQHRYIVDLCEGSIMSPIIQTDRLKMVADIGTGSGTWLLDLDGRLRAHGGSELPAFRGFDTSDLQFPILSADQEPRFKFIVHDPRKPFSQEHIGKYDLVHLRLLMWALPAEEIDTIVANLYSLLKPGGYLAWDEAAYVDSIDASGTPEGVRIHDIVADVMKKRNLCIDLPSTLRKSYDKVGLDMQHSIRYSSLQHPELQKVTNKIIGDGTMSGLRSLIQKRPVTPEQQRLNEQIKSLIVSYPTTHQAMNWQFCLQSVVGRCPQKLPTRDPAVVVESKPLKDDEIPINEVPINGVADKGTSINWIPTRGININRLNPTIKDDNNLNSDQISAKKLMRAKAFSDPKSAESMALKAMVTLNRYRMSYSNDWDLPESISSLRPFLEQAIRNKEHIRLVLPAFPFKSSNRTAKVLGTDPDDAERISILYLEGLCKALEEATELHIELLITSDGVMYNDLLDISDEEVWQYGEGIRRIAKEQGCSHIFFTRLGAIISDDLGSVANLDEYLRNAPEYRRQLEELLPSGFDPAQEIKTNHDVKLTYLGYKRFLDLEMQNASPDGSNLSLRDRKAITAKNMIKRGKAYSEAIKKSYPDAIRLSIHESDDVNKISIAILPLVSGNRMTPWHGALVRAVNGDLAMSHALSVSALTYDLVFEHGKPSYFRERSPLFSWEGMDLIFTYMYPTGIIVRPARKNLMYSLRDVDMAKLRQLSQKCSPIVLRGFQDTRQKSVFVSKAKEMGAILPWKEGDIMVVKDQMNDAPDSNVTTTNEAMPMHYDGMFKLITVKDKQGRERVTSDPPLLQYFVCQATTGNNQGFTLLASSRLFCRYLPNKYPINDLRKVRWTCHSGGYFDHSVPSLPLVVSHPIDSRPCIRWHEPWPKTDTKYGKASITIDNGDQSIVALVDSLLYDKRVCLCFAWEAGDIMVNDNMEMLHTRTAFQRGASRELWRIHVS
ncbi:Pyoverdine biosynthesis [Fusarium mexicanum]|uniref:Pyoverdine biosynthesis n=1 Tax=Fusarium mexicanum TaxID=751941 RepID=A0A8H5MUJ8_9HYPO|nr:Pyoverdine biosynthesis [Fusarium mexicanum]